MFPVQLDTPRLILREPVEADWIAVHAYASDPVVSQFMPWGPNTEEDSRTFIARVLETGKATPRRAFELVVIERSSGKLVGAAGLRSRAWPTFDGDIGYALRRDRWGQGYATELARALVAFGFDTLKLHRIWATCHVANVASARVLEKAGMLFEGTLRSHTGKHGVWSDSKLFATVETDPRSRIVE